MEIQFCNHPHPLVPCDLETAPCCNVCIQKIAMLPFYGCIQCKYFLHESCAELQQELHHPFHPQHPLFLRSNSSSENWCEACCKSFNGGCSVYHCKTCDVYLCIDCILTMPTLKWDDHDHHLAFVKAYYGHTYCGFCNSACCNGESVLHCVPCDFTVHPGCVAKLPQTMQLHHRHCLYLNESLIEDSNEELYCSVCERLRTANQVVYSCNECDFVADLYCAIEEILPKIIMNKGVGGDCSHPEGAFGIDEIDQEISILRNHSTELENRLEDLNLRARELNQEIEKVNKEVKIEIKACFIWEANKEFVIIPQLSHVKDRKSNTFKHV